MAEDFHERAFESSTLTKLELFGKYLRKWLPVFVRENAIWPVINIFDLFSGPGKDIEDEPGSPYIIVKELQSYIPVILDCNLKVRVYFNDNDKKKISNLKQYISSLPFDTDAIEIKYSEEEFENAFLKYYDVMQSKNSASLLFLDQTGIKAVTNKIFLRIVALKQTDLLFFIASSYIMTRFPDHPSMKKYVDVDEIKSKLFEHRDSHRGIWQTYKKMIPLNDEYHLAPFSLKRGANIHGLVFGSGNILGYEKFLQVSWEVDPLNGEANFNIDKDLIAEGGQTSYLDDIGKSKRLREFEENLKRNILDGSLKTNHEMALFALKNRFLPSHIKPVFQGLQRERKVLNGRLGFSRQSNLQFIQLANNG